jgi:hypothetical protein
MSSPVRSAYRPGLSLIACGAPFYRRHTGIKRPGVAFDRSWEELVKAGLISTKKIDDWQGGMSNLVFLKAL